MPHGKSVARIVVYTEDPLLALGASTLLGPFPQFSVLHAEAELFGLVPFVERAAPDAILLDLAPEMTLGLIAKLRKVAPEAKLILWSRSFSETLRYQALELGVAGFIQRGGTTAEFIRNLTEITSGRSEFAGQRKPEDSETVMLTKRESQLVTLLVQGLKNKEIATCLGIAEGTVRIYLSRLFAKIGARDRFEVAVFGLKNSYCGQASWDGRNEFITEGDEDRARPVLKSLVLVEPQRRRAHKIRAAASGR